jgi:hypothetical protein
VDEAGAAVTLARAAYATAITEANAAALEGSLALLSRSWQLPRAIYLAGLSGVNYALSHPEQVNELIEFAGEFIPSTGVLSQPDYTSLPSLYGYAANESLEFLKSILEGASEKRAGVKCP